MGTKTFAALFSLAWVIFADPSFATDLYRIDPLPYSHVKRDGHGLKSYIDSGTGDLLPADSQGTITPLDHVARSRKREIKDRSQFTSFSTDDGLSASYGGGYRIRVNLEEVQADIAAGKLPNTKIYTTEFLLKIMEGDMSRVLKLSEQDPVTVRLFQKAKNDLLAKHYAMVRMEHKPLKESDKFFWDGVNGFRETFPVLFASISQNEFRNYSYVFNGLRHVQSDHEVLIEGSVPAKYLKIEKLIGEKDAVQAIQRGLGALKSFPDVQLQPCF